VISGRARIVPGQAAAGAAPAPGRWEVLGSVTVVGFHASGAAHTAGAERPYVVRIDESGAVEPKRQRQRQRQKPPSLRARLLRRLRRARGAGRVAAGG
jgi:hypothetical protein